MKYAKKAGVNGGAPGTQAVFDDPAMVRMCPALVEYLTETKWEDGSPRQCSTLLLIVDEGSIKGCLNDRANSRSAWVSGGSLTELFQALDEGLKEESLQWRKNQPYQGGGRKK